MLLGKIITAIDVNDGEEKPTESEGFEKIIDFLNANPIKYALTINSTIYTSCIKKFWATSKVNTVNEETQIEALVDKKKVIITETSVKSDLYLEDAECTECLPTAIIFEKMTLMGQGNDFTGKVTPLFETMMVQPQEGEDSKIPTDSHHTPTVTQPSTSFQPQQKQKSKKSKKRIIKANKKTHKLKRLYKIGSSIRVESSEDAGLGDQEDASKKGRMVKDLDADEGVALVDETQGRNDQDMLDTSIFDDDEVVAEKEVSTAKVVPTTDEVVTTVGVKVKPSETSTQTPIDSSQQSSKAKDKSKAKMIDPEQPLKKKDQIMIDEEVAKNLEAHMQAELEEVLFNNTMKWIDLFVPMDTELVKGSKKVVEGSEKTAESNEKVEEGSSKRARDNLVLFNNTIKWIDSFIPMDTKLVKSSEKAVKGSEKTTESSKKAEEVSSKRAGDNLEQEDTKRQRIEEENEYAELKRCLEIIPKDDDDVTIEATPLSSKSPTIVDYKIYKEGRKSFFKIIKKMVDYEVEMAYDLLRLIRRQINEGYGRIVRIKRLHDDLKVTTAQSSFEMHINSVAHQAHNHEDSPSTSLIIVEEHEDPPIVTTSKVQTSLVYLNEADEFNQEDSADFDGNMVFVPYDAPNFKEDESSTTTLEPSNVH
nr:hypothetical protein [Tanacetum cinerariifolium]